MTVISCLFVLIIQIIIVINCAGPEIPLNLYRIEPDFKFRSIGIKKELEHSKVLYDYLYHWKPPGELNIEFNEQHSEVVTYGNYISPLDTLEPPTEIEYLSFFPLSKNFVNELYTLVLDGIDKEGYETSHAIWVNIPFDKDDFESVQLESGKSTFRFKVNLKHAGDLLRFVGPRPLKDTGVHQYVFILFRQPHGWFPKHKLRQRENWGTDHKDHYGVSSWANYYDLQPLGVNFFTSSNEGLF
ncbi:54S ribosomal protein L35, mitochondrial [Wickerhamomyces ciferrii]|uniref:54S ribosomal protein L35, mitochondrial n=1 Tax=Wickerhamomyces ciferrii (strain ATCC 14091 / BCRC 22168 / CBS 111 / JCM 3599 / NBRC 0793 / NRRL Y-1031 F-60-10) TaxID=1206466 RepID=K0KM64_WICCF|nr:54S ribosomal protein L35, mitochondrial [Wickerhamomyces ciferrii]CCH46340.1 54S ribosomal protein L35, mitochondrial [Wickerhamomyces ciferrii]